MLHHRAGRGLDRQAVGRIVLRHFGNSLAETMDADAVGREHHNGTGVQKTGSVQFTAQPVPLVQSVAADHVDDLWRLGRVLADRELRSAGCLATAAGALEQLEMRWFGSWAALHWW